MTSVVNPGASNNSEPGKSIGLSDLNEPMNKNTAIHINPFNVLGVTTRDDRRKIVEMAEERSLHIDHDLCQKARADLTNPRARLSAEMAWMPGVAPRVAEKLSKTLSDDPFSVRSEEGLPELARANLMAAAFELVDENEPTESIAEFIRDFAWVVESIDADDVLRDINEDRAISGFPEVKGIEAIDEELTGRRKAYKSVLRNVLNTMDPNKLVETMIDAVSVATADGENQGPALIDELADTYEVETQGFLQKESENISKLVESARVAAPQGERAVSPILDKLEKVARNWDRVAQPIQISMKARGIVHRPSQDLATEMRDLGVHLFNKHDMMNVARRMTLLLGELFEELPEVLEALENDYKALADIEAREGSAKSDKLRWEHEIAFEEQIGLVFKDTLKISLAGVQWKDARYPLDSITRVRWGVVRHSLNGVPTGTEYTMAFGDNRSEAVVQTKKEAVFSAFTDKLWKSVCIRLMTDILRALRDGKKFALGDGVVDDSGITLMERHTFSADIPVYCSWSEVNIGSADGSFIVGKKGARETNARASYINDANTHLFENLIRINFKGSAPRLSDAIKGN